MNICRVLGTKDIKAASTSEARRTKEVGQHHSCNGDGDGPVKLSCWSTEVLELKQIHYACVDAFVYFEIDKRLLMWSSACIGKCVICRTKNTEKEYKYNGTHSTKSK